MSTHDFAVTVEGLSKIYRIGLKEQAHDTFARAAIDFIRSPLQNYRKYRSLYRFEDVADGSSSAAIAPADIIWALQDVSFQIKHGEVIGFVGRNGAGKSTLLKILPRITPPPRGRAEIRGRVASLLEVGTGFHQELTGRENVYLNGTILGMSRNEIERKFDEIIDFSGIERFIDTPVKRYSSGMTVRLAFAVAAHLEPEILIIDEVLAVGDTAFQKKCINKMQDVGKAGRTVLFVSHNMPAVKMLCNRAILLNGGRLIMDASAHDVVSAYMNTDAGVTAAREWSDPQNAPGGEVARLRGARIVGRNNCAVSVVDIKDDVGLQMEYEVLTSGHVLLPHCYIHNDEGLMLFSTVDQDPAWLQRPRPEGRYTSTVWIPGNLLTDGTIYVSCALLSRTANTAQFYEKQVIAFMVSDNMGKGTARGDWAGWMGGVIRPRLEWETKMERNSDQATGGSMR